MFFKIVSKIFRKKIYHSKESAEKLYSCALKNVRKKLFYQQAGAPDTFDGRFDLLLVHIFIILKCLSHTPKQNNKAIAQDLAERFTEDMEQTLREKGIGDIGISKQIERMIQEFKGRMCGYTEALDSLSKDPDSLKDALKRNVYRESPDVKESYILALEAFILANIEHKISEKHHIIFDNTAIKEAQTLASALNSALNKEEKRL